MLTTSGTYSHKKELDKAEKALKEAKESHKREVAALVTKYKETLTAKQDAINVMQANVRSAHQTIQHLEGVQSNNIKSKNSITAAHQKAINNQSVKDNAKAKRENKANSNLSECHSLHSQHSQNQKKKSRVSSGNQQFTFMGMSRVSKNHICFDHHF